MAPAITQRRCTDSAVDNERDDDNNNDDGCDYSDHDNSNNNNNFLLLIIQTDKNMIMLEYACAHPYSNVNVRH